MFLLKISAVLPAFVAYGITATTALVRKCEGRALGGDRPAARETSPAHHRKHMLLDSLVATCFYQGVFQPAVVNAPNTFPDTPEQ